MGDGMTWLAELREFVKAFKEVWEKVPAEYVVVVVVGTLAIGALSGFGFGWFWRRRRADAAPVDKAAASPPPPATQDIEQLDNLSRLIKELDKDDGELWQFHKSIVPRDVLDKIHQKGLRVITLANLKGGVGKTTLSANLAAYFAECGRRVLLIDFDYQGSLSATVLRAVGKPEVYSEADKLLVGKLSATPGKVRHAGPRLGQHNREVLVDELGFDAATLEAAGIELAKPRAAG